MHADLKPPNVYLIRDPSIGAGYQLKLIDTDFSLLADRRAPWHGHQGYVGTDNYRSPEHLTRGAVPGLPSDVFTCGLLLYELLTGRHPYWRDDQAEYAALVRAHAAEPPALAGVLPAPAENAAVARRAVSVSLARSGRTPDRRRAARGAQRPRRHAPAPPRRPRRRPRHPRRLRGRHLPHPPHAPPPAATARVPITTERSSSSAPAAHALQVGVRTELGKHLARQFGPDAEFWDARQCVVERGAAGWQVTPVAGTPNETLLNGETLTAPRPLRDGDVLAVGRQAKGIVKLPLTVRAL